MGNTCQGVKEQPHDEYSVHLQPKPSKSYPHEELVGEATGPESVEWANLCIRSYWPTLDNVAADLLKTTIEPAIKKALPSFPINLKEDFKFSKFTLGTATPKLDKVKGQSRSDDARLSCTFNWASNLQLEIQAGPVKGGLHAMNVSGQISVVFAIQKDTFISGWGFSVYFLDAPEIDLEFSGIVSVAHARPIRKVMQSVIASQLRTRMVLPNVMQLIIGNQATNTSTTFRLGVGAKPVGCVRVTLLKVNDLKGSDGSNFMAALEKRLTSAIGNSQKYLTLKLGGREWRSESIDPSTHHSIMVHDLRQRLKIEIWDEGVLTHDDKIGEAGPFKVKDALAHSGKTVELKPKGSIDFNVVWLKAVPGELGTDGCIICVSLEQLIWPLDAGEKVKVTLQLEKGSDASIIQEGDETRLIDRAESRFYQDLEVMKNYNVSGVDLEKMKQDNIHLIKKVGVSGQLHVHVAADQMKTDILTLNILVADEAGDFKKSGSPWKKPISEIAKATNARIKGPFKLGYDHEIEGEIQLWGLFHDSLDSS
jgi:hypothetical protein